MDDQSEAITRWQHGSRAVTEIVSGGLKSRVRLENKLSTLVSHAMSTKGLSRVVDVLQLPPPRRSEEDIKFCVKFLSKHQFETKWFRNKLRSQIESLCRVMTAVVCEPNHLVYNQHDFATHAYVVMEGRVGAFVPEDKAIKSDFAAHMQRTRILALAGKLHHSMREAQSELDAAKAAMGIPSAMALAESKEAGDEGEEKEKEAPKVKLDPTETPGTRWFDDDEEAAGDGEDDVDVGGGIAADVAPTNINPAATTRDPTMLWRWAFSKILTMLRTGGALLDLAMFARRVDGVKWVQVQLYRKGALFGDVDLFHPRRARSAAVWTKTKCVLFMVPREAYVELRSSMESTGDLVEDVTFLNTLPWMASAPPDSVVRLAHEARKSVVSRGTVIVAEGTSDPAVVVIKQGSVRVECHGQNRARRGRMLPVGLPFQLGLLGPGEWFGEKSLLTGLPSDFSFVADTQCVLLVISARSFFPHQRRASTILLSHFKLMTEHRTRRLMEMSDPAGAHAGTRLGKRPQGGVKPANAAFPLRGSAPALSATATFSLASPTKPPLSKSPPKARTPETPAAEVAFIHSRPETSPLSGSRPVTAPGVPTIPDDVDRRATIMSLVSPIHNTVTDSARAKEVSLLGFCRPSASVFAAGGSPPSSSFTKRAFNIAETQFSLSPRLKTAGSTWTVGSSPDNPRPLAKGTGHVGKGRSRMAPKLPPGGSMELTPKKLSVVTGASPPAGKPLVWKLRSSRPPSSSSTARQPRRRGKGPKDIRSFYMRNQVASAP